eukprot:282452_1
MAPVGNVSITVMIKERNVDNAITCYPIHAAFKTIADSINASSIVNDILTRVSSITNATSFSEHPDVAVSIVTVIDYIYAENLTTQNAAAQIVHDIVTNIIEGSSVLDIVQNKSDNISLVADDIITELSTISTITSNEEIVDADTTTTVLVDTYLPQIFEAIDIFIASATLIQDELYTIAGQSQELIVSLESTLQVHVNKVNNLTQSLAEYATLAASKALSESDVGETFTYQTTEYNENGTIQNTKTIIATKFDANIIDFNGNTIADQDIVLPKCGDG